MVTDWPLDEACSAARCAIERTCRWRRSRYCSTSTTTLPASSNCRPTIMLTTNWKARSVSPRRPMMRPASSPSISMTAGSSPPPWLRMVGVASTPMASRMLLTTSNAAFTCEPSSPVCEPPSPIRDTRTLAGSEPRPRIPERPWLTTSTSTSSRSTPSSRSASSIASSTVFAVSSRLELSIVLLLIG